MWYNLNMKNIEGQESTGQEVPISEDRKVIEEITEDIPDFNSEEKIMTRRVYGDLRRSGKSTQKVKGLFMDDPLEETREDFRARAFKLGKHTEDRRIEKIERIRNEKIAELGYEEVLEHPEEYLYHGSTTDGQGGIKEKGLMANPYQSEEKVASISWHTGTQELHQNPETKYFHGFGGGGKYRVKASDLEEAGFIMEPFGDSGAVETSKRNPVVPTSILEKWDDSIRLWLPLDMS